MKPYFIADVLEANDHLSPMILCARQLAVLGRRLLSRAPATRDRSSGRPRRGDSTASTWFWVSIATSQMRPSEPIAATTDPGTATRTLFEFARAMGQISEEHLPDWRDVGCQASLASSPSAAMAERILAAWRGGKVRPSARACLNRSTTYGLRRKVSKLIDRV
jgi:hypothetical protein